MVKNIANAYACYFFFSSFEFKAGPPPPLEAILVIFGRGALIFFCLKALGIKWKMTPLLCACAVVITLETQKCRKRAPRSVEFNFFIICDRHKRFLQNERRRIDLQNVASDFLILAWGLSYDLSKFGDDFTPFFGLRKTITKSLDKNLKNLRLRFVAMNMMNKCAKFHKDSPSGKKVKFNLARAIELSETAVFVYNFV